MTEAHAAYVAGNPNLAETLLNQVLAADPRNSAAIFALGTIFASIGKPDQAIERFRLVARLDPKNSQAQYLAGLLLVHRGGYSEAVPYLEQAISALPQNLQALASLGQAFYYTHQPSRALAAFAKAIALNPNDVELRLARARCYRALTRDGEAEGDLKLALRAGPNPAVSAALAEIQLAFGRAEEALSNAKASLETPAATAYSAAYLVAARALMSLDRPAEAEKYWTKAEEVATSPETFLTEKSKAFISAGRFDEAREMLLKSIALNPLNPDAYFRLLYSKKTTEQDLDLLTTVEGLTHHKDTKDTDRAPLLYALGKANDDLGRYETAIHFFDQANALKLALRPKDIAFNLEDFRAHVDSQITRYTLEFLEEHRAEGNPSNIPIFIVGMMRSGTTLLEQILSCHPEVGGAGEQSFWYDHERELVNPTTGRFSFPKLERFSKEYLALLSSSAPGYNRIVDKNPANCIIVGLLTTTFPNAKIIHTRRNPVDTAISIWTTPMETTAPFVNDRANIVSSYQEYERVTDHWRKTLPADRYLEVDYESLTGEPEATVRNILEFLELDWNEACIHPERNKRSIKTPSFWQVRQPLYRTSEGRWKRYEPWLGPFRNLIPTKP